ncbi:MULTISPECIES: hypothetical protein [unclassified Pseudoalteromonas]|uniref:hypothetical protein n=1 Tax=unclassified Pseudoalteromonas TaxID=194690 RepID=UPI0025B34C35|nr:MULTISPECIES: hypothetical protein [unclassified Pseudoalteromonas]MDN3380837.1 hypothetical protein [Pseudoalteromonas sp. APC 3893]MDN3389244.1 hypothetical protein [Pseudoalteromonas sp. APC 4017]
MMNTLLLTMMLLSPNHTTIENEIKQQTAQVVSVIQLENKAQIKKQIANTLESMELKLPVVIDEQTLAKNVSPATQLSQD